jgi:molybdopterin-guanine dinucleotide biosynthesis protein A/nucleoside-triphosphatase THEP1
MNWIAGQKDVGGILTPDVNGQRMLYDINQGDYYPLQVTNKENAIQIGRFSFDQSIFHLAQQILLESMNQQHEWVIVDEIGRLEMDKQSGLEPAVSAVIKNAKTKASNTKLLLVIRDYLLNDAIQYYGLQGATVLHKSFFEITSVDANNKLYGVVLCGGQSVRMGTDKAFISYHDKPQYAYTTELIKPYCESVFISCNNKQNSQIPQNYNTVLDNATFADAGPMTGVLSAFEKLNNQSILLIGCDYPHLLQTDIEALLAARNECYDAVCFIQTETNIEEPLLAVYEKQCAPLLLDFFSQGNTSMRKFLTTIRTHKIVPESLKRIQSIDTPIM